MNKKQQQAYGYGHGQGDVPGYCCFHPREVVVGVCAHCLKDRLLLLLAAANNNNNFAAADADAVPRRSRSRSRSSSISLPKVFALGSSFLQRLDSRHHRGPDNYSISDDDAATASVASLDEDSFISIKFEDNGKATWDSVQSQHKAAAEAEAEAGKPAAAPARSSSTTSTVVVVEHVKRGGVTRWRKQVVGRLLQLARWRRSSAAAKAGACHVGGLDGKKAAASAAAERSKGRGRGWIRSLTRRRAHGDRAW